MRRRASPLTSLQRALTILERIVEDAAEHNATGIAAQIGIPVASLHRIAVSLKENGYLVAASRGRYVAGPALLALSHTARQPRTLAAFARPKLEKLAAKTGHIVHLGVLEDDMVTYIVKSDANGNRLFTREGMQLEAYCSSIGKVLLAHLDAEERARYLANGPFIALTSNTRTDPITLRDELDTVRLSGFALDDREVQADLICIAVPIRWPNGNTRAAMSLSQQVTACQTPRFDLLGALLDTANHIERTLNVMPARD